MSEIECFLSLSLCCFQCGECYNNTNNTNNTNTDNNYYSISENKEQNYENLDNIKVLFIYNKSNEKIDKNIEKIIFYDEYLRGYYDKYNIEVDKKHILVIPNSQNISDIINIIHKNNGLTINKKKWIPKYILIQSL